MLIRTQLSRRWRRVGTSFLCTNSPKLRFLATTHITTFSRQWLRTYLTCAFRTNGSTFFVALCSDALITTALVETQKDSSRLPVLLSELQNWGYLPNATHNALRRLTNKRLIETTERVTFEEDALGELTGEIPSALRITSVGFYHIRKWLGSFAYLDAMAFDTPIFRGGFMERMSRDPDLFSIESRFSRTEAFRDYLSAVWEESALNPSYFNWPTSLAVGVASFDGAEHGVRRARDANLSNDRKRAT